VTDRETYDPTATAVALLSEMRWQSGRHWAWREGTFDRLAGTDRLRHAIEADEPVERIFGRREERLGEFRQLRTGYLIYE
jgi:uncharacterized protein YbbC (DUF1343 family)